MSTRWATEFLTSNSGTLFIIKAVCRLREETIEATGKMKVMLSAMDQGEFMKMMVQLSGAKKGIEVGVFTGYSALCMAEGLPEDGKLYALDVSEEWTSIGKKYWEEAGVDDKIDLILSPGVETLDKMVEDEGNLETFDFAFVDADKPNYDNYYERILKLLKPNGFIMFDNVLWHGAVIKEADPEDEDTKAFQELNKKLQEDERITISMIPIADGLTIARKV